MNIMNWSAFFRNAGIVGSRYLILSGIAFLLCYVLLRRIIQHKKIQQRFPKIGDYARELFFSLLSILILAFIPTIILNTPQISRHTFFYKDIHQYSMVYFVLAFPLMAIIHDTYFYWAHRLMHHPKWFKWVHLVHHKSTNPSPFAAYAFHPLEAVVESGIFLIFVFTMPVHLFHLLFFFLFMIIYNVYGHLGWELYPKGFSKHRLGKWVNTSVAHNQHHQYFKGNYGLYFLFWDRMMGTLREDYDEKFSTVKNK